MSHIIEARTEIIFTVQDPTGRQSSEELLDQAYVRIRQAVGIVASQYQPYRSWHARGYQQEWLVTDFYLNWTMQECRTYHAPNERKAYPVKLGLFVEGLTRGIGIFIHPVTGELRFVGDAAGVQTLFTQLKNQIVQTYTALQFQAVLAEIGYQTSLQSGEQGQLILRGVSYAA